MIELHASRQRVHIRLRALTLGRDVCIIIDGGDKAHIGAVSLRAHECKTQTLCLKGHKEDVITARVAKNVHLELKCAVTCLCGIHIQNISKEEIDLVFLLVDELVKKAISMHKEMHT